MLLTPMSHQNIMGIYARPSQSVRFFKRQPRIVSEVSSISPPRTRVEIDRAFADSLQVIARFAGH
jgi:hypothetical protein